MASKCMKRCSVALIIEEMQIRTWRGESHHEHGGNPEAAGMLQRTHRCGRRGAALAEGMQSGPACCTGFGQHLWQLKMVSSTSHSVTSRYLPERHSETLHPGTGHMQRYTPREAIYDKETPEVIHIPVSRGMDH